MMGVPMSREQAVEIKERIAARKERVASSLGMTLEEFEEQARQNGQKRKEEQQAEKETEEEEQAVEDDIDEEAILRYIRTRQETIDKLRGRIKLLEGKVRHLEAQRDLADKKVEALRDALAKMREAAKKQKAEETGATPSEETPASEE